MLPGRMELFPQGGPDRPPERIGASDGLLGFAELGGNGLERKIS
jgi:hypothetical protein